MSKSQAIVRDLIERDPRSRYRIARESGITEATLSRIVNGKRDLSADMLERLTDALGYDVILKKRPTRRRS